MIDIKVEIKPLSINDAFQGRRFKTKESKQFDMDMATILPRKEMIRGIVEIHYQFFMVNHSMADYDNVIKCFQDNLVKKGYIEDDRKIYRAVIDKIPSKEDYVKIIIKEYVQ